jgi:hypothetical protein
MEMVVRELVGEGDGVRSQVDAGHVEAFGQNAGMPAPAAGDIQQGRNLPGALAAPGDGE